MNNQARLRGWTRSRDAEVVRASGLWPVSAPTVPSRCRSRSALILSALALTGCATTPRYVETYCLSRSQFDTLKSQEPGKIHDQLTGRADKDSEIIAGSAIRLRAYSEGLLGVLGGCVDSNTEAPAK
jgi:hypothetical protein